MIEVINLQRKARLRVRSFRDLVAGLVRRYRLKDPDIVLAFVDDRRIKLLNREFRGKDKATDVLSFPIGTRGPDGRYFLGDIIISVPRAAAQAAEKNHDLDRELRILVIHGFLHLLGYKHFRGMEAEEAKVRRKFLGA
ncbi:MAG: rRNA maturation RNase YbeY [Candidatus Aminicenantes bacterium]|jgi:probable rRNA maturation factor|nr:rRNA maturation RNase YbeY [Candidatus Aminicenantes bacterium]